MIDERRYTDSYDLYRPTVVTSASRSQTVTVPDTPTASAQSCLFFPKPGVLRPTPSGAELPYDARLHVPADRDILPAKQGDTADVVVVGAQTFTVLVAYAAAGRGQYKIVALKEQRG